MDRAAGFILCLCGCFHSARCRPGSPLEERLSGSWRACAADDEVALIQSAAETHSGVEPTKAPPEAPTKGRTLMPNFQTPDFADIVKRALDWDHPQDVLAKSESVANTSNAKNDLFRTRTASFVDMTANATAGAIIAIVSTACSAMDSVREEVGLFREEAHNLTALMLDAVDRVQNGTESDKFSAFAEAANETVLGITGRLVPIRASLRQASVVITGCIETAGFLKLSDDLNATFTEAVRAIDEYERANFLTSRIFHDSAPVIGSQFHEIATKAHAAQTWTHTFNKTFSEGLKELMYHLNETVKGVLPAAQFAQVSDALRTLPVHRDRFVTDINGAAEEVTAGLEKAMHKIDKFEPARSAGVPLGFSLITVFFSPLVMLL